MYINLVNISEPSCWTQGQTGGPVGLGHLYRLIYTEQQNTD